MVEGITGDELSARFPKLYHMAELGSWPSIQKYGLLSTTALLDLFEMTGDDRFRIESCHRPESVTIVHTKHGPAVVRDQKPMSDDSLKKALAGSMKNSTWYRLLNSKVFFWLNERRLTKLLGARAYRNKRHDVLVLDTRRIVAAHESKIALSPMNSGCTIPFPHKRGPQTFRSLATYPYHSRKRLRDPIVELAVEYSVSDIAESVLEVWESSADHDRKLIWKR